MILFLLSALCSSSQAATLDDVARLQTHFLKVVTQLEELRESRTRSLSPEEIQYIRMREGLVGLDDRQIGTFYVNALGKTQAELEDELFGTFAALQLESAPRFEAVPEHFVEVVSEGLKGLNFKASLDSLSYSEVRKVLQTKLRSFTAAELDEIRRFSIAVSELASESVWSRKSRALDLMESSSIPTEAHSLLAEAMARPVKFTTPSRCCEMYLRGSGCIQCPLNVYLRRLNQETIKKNPELAQLRKSCKEMLLPRAPSGLALYLRQGS